MRESIFERPVASRAVHIRARDVRERAPVWAASLGLVTVLVVSRWLLAGPQVADATVSSYAPSVTPELVAGGLDGPVHVTHAGDGSGRLFIVEKAGLIRIFDDGAMLGTPFLDIQGRVGSSGNEQGLLSIAFPPDYASTGVFYVDYTDTSGDTVVARYEVSDNPDLASADSEAVILTVDQPQANHNGGQLAFGPDGNLYIGLGDGGGGGDPYENAQDPAALLGKLLRLTVPAIGTYTVPADNPFVVDNDPQDDYRDEIWALGLRNPWRFAFDGLTGDLFIGDVGQGSWEEIDYQPASSAGGENYGWDCYEGNHEYETTGCGDADEYVFPVLEYPHAGSRSVTGGTVYRGARFPHMYGFYFYADYVTGEVWSARQVGGSWEHDLVYDASYSISSFGVDESGEMYIVKYAGAPNGALYRLTDPSFTLCDADYGGDGMVGPDDLAALEPYWSSQDGDGTYDAAHDFIYDGVIDVEDFVWLGTHIGTGCS